MAVRTEVTGRRPSRNGGFSVVEAVMSLLIVSVMLAAALNTVGSAARAHQVRANRQLGPALAEQLMSEILQARYESPDAALAFGPEPGEMTGTRYAFDDVDDYDGWVSSPPVYKDGTAVPNASGWKRQVQVCFANPSGPSGPAMGTDSGLKRITVTVNAPGGQKTVLTALRSASGSYEQQPAAKAEYLTWANIELQIGSESTNRVSAATNFLNRVGITTE